MFLDMQGLLANTLDFELWRGPALIANQPSLSQILKEKRLDMQLKQGQIGKPLGIDQTTVSLYEREPERLRARGADFTIRFIKSYGFSEIETRDLAQQLFSDVLKELGSPLTPDAPDPLARFAPEPMEWVHFQVMTSASAGTGEPEFIDDDEIVSIPLEKLKRRGAKKSDVMVVKVNGNCLVSQNIRFSQKNIAHGDYAFIHVGAMASSTDIICLWDDSEGQLILKFLAEQQDPRSPDEVTLLDAKGNRYIRNVADIIYRGVVFHRSGDL